MHNRSQVQIEHNYIAEPSRPRAHCLFLNSLLPLIFALSFLLAGCSFHETSRDFFAMDTVMHLSASGSHAEQGLDAAEDEINRLDRLFSISNADSDIARLNQSGSTTVSDETLQLLARSKEINSQTGCAFDITVYPVASLWGFYSGNFQVPDQKALSAALSSVGMDHVQVNHSSVTLDSGTQLDLGAIAKGYASNRAAKIIEESGVTSANLSLGGNVHVVGTKPDGSNWKVAITDPNNTDHYAGVLSVQDTAVVTSGGYERFFQADGKTYHHILDPKTGYPADSGLLSVTIVSQDDVLADALSTALFVMGEDRAVDFWRASTANFEMVLITRDGRIRYSEGLESAFSLAADYKAEVIHR